ncbi:MAG: hypothetical protein R2713_04690 [Ilumatobacteraceae bacterium]
MRRCTVWVDAGDGVERHVWCGAFNMSPGDVIPLATPGTRMPDGRLIEPRPILGIDSQGMLCSARELGLGDDHSGILILDGATPLGLPYGEALALRSEVFDVDLTRNRPDCWGHLGAARDVAARVGVDLAPGPPPLAPTGDARSATVELVDGERCPRFTTVVLGHPCRPVAGVDGAPAAGRRDALDQQRGRREQLRDARAQPAQPRLRPRHARRPRLPHPPGATASR